MTGLVLICVSMPAIWLAVYAFLTARARTAPYQGRHVPFADPRDRTDPDGTGYIGVLLQDPATDTADTSGADEPDWWYHPDPDSTRAGLHAVNTWGMTPPQLADYLAARYMP